MLPTPLQRESWESRPPTDKQQEPSPPRLEPPDCQPTPSSSEGLGLWTVWSGPQSWAVHLILQFVNEMAKRQKSKTNTGSYVEIFYILDLTN